jgi:anti-sigma regulatory factor (Ser/Thr protein kinase)
MNTLRHAVPGGDTRRREPVSAAAEQVLAAQPISVSLARQFACDTLAAWRLAAISRDVSVVVSELAANAVREGQASGRGEVLVRLTRTDSIVFALVGDHNPLPPPRPAAADAASGREHGRGLTIAKALSWRLGWYEDPGWKIVWAAFMIPPASAARAATARRGRATACSAP